MNDKSNPAPRRAPAPTPEEIRFYMDRATQMRSEAIANGVHALWRALKRPFAAAKPGARTGRTADI